MSEEQTYEDNILPGAADIAAAVGVAGYTGRRAAVAVVETLLRPRFT